MADDPRPPDEVQQAAQRLAEFAQEKVGEGYDYTWWLALRENKPLGGVRPTPRALEIARILNGP